MSCLYMEIHASVMPSTCFIIQVRVLAGGLGVSQDSVSCRISAVTAPALTKAIKKALLAAVGIHT
jgi:hypothetical protein